jgi:hypothetical protein
MIAIFDLRALTAGNGTFIAFSSEVVTRSRQENLSKQKAGARL